MFLKTEVVVPSLELSKQMLTASEPNAKCAEKYMETFYINDVKGAYICTGPWLFERNYLACIVTIYPVWALCGCMQMDIDGYRCWIFLYTAQWIWIWGPIYPANDFLVILVKVQTRVHFLLIFGRSARGARLTVSFRILGDCQTLENLDYYIIQPARWER